MELMYNTHSPLSPNSKTTPDLFYKKEIKHGQIYGDDQYKLEMKEYYDEWL